MTRTPDFDKTSGEESGLLLDATTMASQGTCSVEQEQTALFKDEDVCPDGEEKENWLRKNQS